MSLLVERTPNNGNRARPRKTGFYDIKTNGWDLSQYKVSLSVVDARARARVCVRYNKYESVGNQRSAQFLSGLLQRLIIATCATKYCEYNNILPDKK